MGKTNRQKSGESIARGVVAGLVSAPIALVPAAIEHQAPPAPIEMHARTEASLKPETEAQKQEKEEEPPERTYIEERIAFYAEKYGVSYADMHRVVSCETAGTFDPKIQSYVPDSSGPGGREDSWGLAQIHLPAHNVTREQAQDMEFALNFMAKHFARGEHRMWTCWGMTE